jgi:hypothetical protein
VSYTAPASEEFGASRTTWIVRASRWPSYSASSAAQLWRKYTGGVTPREISPRVLFFSAARFALSDGQIARVLVKMRWKCGIRLCSSLMGDELLCVVFTRDDRSEGDAG